MSGTSETPKEINEISKKTEFTPSSPANEQLNPILNLCISLIFIIVTINAWKAFYSNTCYDRSLSRADAVVTSVKKEHIKEITDNGEVTKVTFEYSLSQGKLPEKQIRSGSIFFGPHDDFEKYKLKTGQRHEIFIEPSGQIVMEAGTGIWVFPIVILPFTILSIAAAMGICFQLIGQAKRIYLRLKKLFVK